MGVKMVLSYRLQQNVGVKLHTLKQIPLQLGKLSQQPADLMLLSSTLLIGAPTTAISEL